MKTIDAIVEYCDCGCQHCEYSDDTCALDVACPYCDGAEEQKIYCEQGEKEKIQCSYCNKKFWAKKVIEYV